MRIEEGKYTLTFPRETCDFARFLFVDDNPFHDPDVDPNAIVPGGLIIGAVGGAVANFLPGRKLRKFTIEFFRPVPIGGTIHLTLKRCEDEARWSAVAAILSNEQDKPICRPTKINLEKGKGV